LFNFAEAHDIKLPGCDPVVKTYILQHNVSYHGTY